MFCVESNPSHASQSDFTFWKCPNAFPSEAAEKSVLWAEKGAEADGWPAEVGIIGILAGCWTREITLQRFKHCGKRWHSSSFTTSVAPLVCLLSPLGLCIIVFVKNLHSEDKLVCNLTANSSLFIYAPVELKVKAPSCLWSSSNVMRTPHENGVGSGVGYYRGLSSLNREASWLRIFLLCLLQVMQSVLPSFLPSFCWQKTSGLFCSHPKLSDSFAALRCFTCAFNSAEPRILETQSLFN